MKSTDCVTSSNVGETMIPINTDLKNVREVDGCNLEHLTKEGWQLICIIQEKSVTGETAEMDCPGPTQDRPCEHGIYWGSKCYSYVRKPLVGVRQTTKYIVGQPADDATRELHATIEQLRVRLDRECQERNTAQTQLKEHAEQLSAVTEERDNLKAAAEKLRTDLTEERVAVKTTAKELSDIEQQIGKLRAEFGEREVRRVLGS